MFLKSKILTMLAAVGYGVLFSLALTAGVRIACILLGMTLPASAAGESVSRGQPAGGRSLGVCIWSSVAPFRTADAIGRYGGAALFGLSARSWKPEALARNGPSLANASGYHC
jgi:hypothetical protein